MKNPFNLWDDDWFKLDQYNKIEQQIKDYQQAQIAAEQEAYYQKVKQYEQMILKSKEQHKDFIIQQQADTIKKLEQRIKDLEFKNKFEDMLNEK